MTKIPGVMLSSVLLVSTIVPNTAFADCAKFPRFCAAASILEEQPNVDFLAGVRAQAGLALLQENLREAQTDRLAANFQATQIRMDASIRESRQRVDQLFEAAKPDGFLSAADKLLKTIGFLANLAQQVQALKTEFAQADGDEAANLENGERAPANDTGIMLLSDEHFVSQEAKARALRLAASREGSRYFTVRAIIDRLEELGPPNGDGSAALPIEQEYLLAEAFAVLAGWEETKADSFFQEFDLSINSLDDVFDGKRLPHPAIVFLEIFFKSQPVGDGTIESVLNVPGFERELSIFAEQQFRWRYPEYFEKGGTVPWRLDD